MWDLIAEPPDVSIDAGSLKVSVCGGSGWWRRSCAGPVYTTGLVVRQSAEVSKPGMIVNIGSVSRSELASSQCDNVVDGQTGSACGRR